MSFRNLTKKGHFGHLKEKNHVGSVYNARAMSHIIGTQEKDKLNEGNSHNNILLCVCVCVYIYIYIVESQSNYLVGVGRQTQHHK